MTKSQAEQVYDAQRDSVQVIRRGVVPSERVYNATCRKCSSELRFRRGIAKFHDDQRDGAYLSVPCPVCGDQVTVQA